MRGRKLEVVLKADQGEEPAPTFVFNAPTIATQEAVADAYDAAMQAKDAKQLAAGVIDSLRPAMVGWKNIDRKFESVDDLRDVVSLTELLELAGEFLAGGNLTADDKKKIRLGALIACGELCENCSAHRCRSDEVGLYLIECPVCNGTGCEECEDGRWQLGDCPNRLAQDLGSFFDLAAMLDAGIPPNAGGACDQPLWFVRAYRRYKHDITVAENERIRRLDLARNGRS
jgi:hypothetical protein